MKIVRKFALSVQDFYRNAQVLFSTLPPFLIKTGVATQEELEALSEQMHDEWRRFWMNDQPSHLTPYRIHGGVGPASSTIQ